MKILQHISKIFVSLKDPFKETFDKIEYYGSKKANDTLPKVIVIRYKDHGNRVF